MNTKVVRSLFTTNFAFADRRYLTFHFTFNGRTVQAES